MAYDHAVYGMRFRKWFGVTPLYGGGFAAGFSLGSGSATHVASWYPDQPIKLQKFGFRALVACDTHPITSTGYVPHFFGKNGVSLGTLASEVIASLHTRTVAKEALASTATMKTASKQLFDPGDYLTIKTGTVSKQSGSVQASSVNGVVAYFVDYAPRYTSVSDNFWEV